MDQTNHIAPGERTPEAGAADTVATPEMSARTRILNAPIPEPVYWLLRQNALASRLSFKAYLARCLADTKPYPPQAS